MASILKSYDWSYVSQNNKRARERSYPWEDWFDGRIWKLEPNVDFDGPATSLERVMRTSANRKGIKVRIRIDEGNIVVQRHEEAHPTRTVTRSPSIRALREAEEAAAEAARKAEAKAARAARAAARKAAKEAAPHTNGNHAVTTKTIKRRHAAV